MSRKIQAAILAVVVVLGTVGGVISFFHGEGLVNLITGFAMAGVLSILIFCYKLLSKAMNKIAAGIVSVIAADLIAIAFFDMKWLGYLIMSVVGIGYLAYLIQLILKDNGNNNQ